MTPITMTFPNLNNADVTTLNNALIAAQNGATVTIAVTYNKVTKTAPRIAGEDYRPLLGATKDMLVGVVKKVAVGKNGPYILLDATLTRAPLNGDGEVETTKLGWTSIKPEGIKGAQVLATIAAKVAATA